MPVTTTKKATTLKALQTRLRSNRHMFDEICSFADTLGVGTTAIQVTARLEKLEEMWEKMNEAIMDVEMHEDFPVDDDSLFKERSDFGNRYFTTKSALMEKLKELEEVPALNSTSRGLDSTLPPTMDHVRLPQIRMQTFDGNVDEWLSFRDLYTSLIHWKTDLPDVEKFHYLKGCLAGEAKALIDPLAITRANYPIAWDTLTKRYNDSKVLKRRQVQALFKLPSLTKESANELKSLLEGFERVVQTLDQLIQPADYKDLLLLDILSTRLDSTTRRGCEEHSATKEQDTVKDLTEFLQRRVKVLGSLPSKPTGSQVDVPVQNRRKQPFSRASNSATQATGGRCVACSEDHPLYQCSTFKRMTVSGRDKLLRNHSLCRNCFRRGHQAADCQSRFVCRNCNSKHHTMVCFRSERSSPRNSPNRIAPKRGPQRSGNARETVQEPNPTEAGASTSGAVSSNMAGHRSSSVLLATAVVLVEDDEGVRYPARALLDSGSECNFMAERMCQLLKVQRRRSDIAVLGIGQGNTRVKHKLEATVKSRVTGFSRKMEFLLLPKVTANLPTTEVEVTGWAIPPGVELADPAFFKTNAVDMVLGIEYFFEIFNSGNKMELGKGLPTLTESVFGWVVSGMVSLERVTPRISCNAAVSMDLEELLTRFWSCEEIGLENNNYSPEESRCEEQYVRTVRRGSDGRYTVSLPKVKDTLARMGESRDIAFRRLQGIERRLLKEPALREQYTEFMEEYLRLGHMRKVECGKEPNVRCYLPHHPVVKQESTTTKVRVVFDASCKSNTGVSLNDALMTGPVIQDDLRSIILRSRTHPIMLVSDVEKMFRQVNVNADDHPLQSILWRRGFEEEVGTYELTTVTYGTKPAPFLATRTLKRLAEDEQAQFPLAARAVAKDVYMDDVITGTDNPEEAKELRIQLDAMMQSGGFRLRKWVSNCEMVLQGVPEENLALAKADGIQLDPDPAVRTLGLVWHPGTDVLKFQFKIGEIDPVETLTKRKVLSIIATLFDPLGLVGAVTTMAKLFMQRLWCLGDDHGRKLDWDTLLPLKISDEWRNFHQQLSRLNELSIPRCVIVPKAVKVELHFFSDASERAYGACCYVRSVDSAGAVRIVLLTSKSKVAPLKSQSIPRLELCGALLGAQLSEKVLKSIELDVTVYYWTDSTCVLQWLKAIPSTWTIFVANRVAKIQTITENRPWKHVPGVQNPADLISRGVLPEQIKNNKLWWEGPNWLQQEQECWPSQPCIAEVEDVEKEVRRATAQCTAVPVEQFSDWYLSKFSSYSDLIRRTAYWLRLMKTLRKTDEPETMSEDVEKLNHVDVEGPSNADEEDESSSREVQAQSIAEGEALRVGKLEAPIVAWEEKFLTTKELQEAERTIIQRVQREAFPEEWKVLSNGGTVARSSPLRWFHPHMSSDNLIRVGGRLGNSQEAETRKHPMVLPARHRLTRLLFEQFHHRLLHAGPQLLLASVRQKYWPLGGRNVAREVVHKCQRCFRTKPSPIQQFMGELPAARVTISRPFSKTGVDYFGPVYVSPGPRRKAVKAYVALFVCLCTKAVHLELVTDLSTERFLQALRRFTSRRGKCSDIYSDNGTNFVGARNQLQELLKLLRSEEHWEKVAKECALDGIQWHFNPPSAPHFGGLWEAAVRSAKIHLLKVLGNTAVSFEDMQTLLAQVECCLNSRPLTPMSDDPDDLEPLTPGHFLTGASLQEIPDRDYNNIQLNGLKYWQATQKMLQEFWKRWRREYLSQLQGRMKRWRPAVEINIGQLVVIKDENLPPIRWKMARVHQLHPGNDGVIRVVTLKTTTGFLKRPVEKLCILPSQ